MADAWAERHVKETTGGGESEQGTPRARIPFLGILNDAVRLVFVVVSGTLPPPFPPPFPSHPATVSGRFRPWTRESDGEELLTWTRSTGEVYYCDFDGGQWLDFPPQWLKRGVGAFGKEVRVLSTARAYTYVVCACACVCVCVCVHAVD